MKDGKILVLAALLIAAFVFFKSRNVSEKNAALRQASKLSASPKDRIIDKPKTDLKADASAEMARKNYNVMLLNGITRVPVEVRGNKIRVSVLPKPQPLFCRPGDFDLIKSLPSNSQEKFLTLSIESALKGSVKVSESYSLSDISGNKVATFDIPAEDGAYGLYLCTDSSKKGACGRKATLNPLVWNSGPGPVKKLAQDKVIYFQLLVVKSGSLSIIPSSNWGKENIAQLKVKLKDWMGSDVEALDKMDAMVSKLQPMPAAIAGTAIEIPLPYNDFRCVRP